jgi:dGTPase
MNKNPNFEKILGLLKEDRLRDSTAGKRGILIASESDKGRVINSAAFRRLQQKAQVFPLEPNAAVRTRLTHSIEVSQIGRHICQKIIEKLDGFNSSTYNLLAAFVNTIETACLLHDIGNPPFGHFGESAIRDWFMDREKQGKSVPKDAINFDGNPQGFRLASFLSGADDYGFNLTCTLLLSIVKYPYTSRDKESNSKVKKIGLFISEHQYYLNVCDKLNWDVGQKFPLMRLMDAADDIAYSMSDLEDGLEKHIISLRQLKDDFNEIDLSPAHLDPFIRFKTNVINRAVEVVADNFIKECDGIFGGEDVDLLPKETEVGDLIKRVKSYAIRNIYSHFSAEQVELAGRSVITGLLKHFGCLLDLEDADFYALVNEDYRTIKKRQLDYHIRLLRRIPKDYILKYKSKVDCETTKRAHLIIDWISGMTDDFALETYQVLEGIRIR